MTRTYLSMQAPSRRGLALPAIASRAIARRGGIAAGMAAAFLVALALAAIVLAVAGTGERGTVLALWLTGRWMFALFWPAYAGGALASLCGPRFDALARRGRAFGLAFAAALAVHVALVLWLLYVAADQRSPMILFWSGVACACLLALASPLRLRETLGPRLWRLFCAGALDYLALLFAIDFILDPLRRAGSGVHVLTDLPFAVMLVAGAALRLAAFARRLSSASRA